MRFGIIHIIDCYSFDAMKRSVMMKSSALLFVLLAVLGTFIGSATATAQPVEPSFFPVASFEDYVASGQPVAIKMVDLALGEVNQFFVCRDLNSETACFPPVESGGTFVDTIPGEFLGQKVAYQIAKVSSRLGGTTDWGYVRGQVGFASSVNQVVGTTSVKAEPKIVQCKAMPGMECPMVWITEPNRLQIQAVGNYPTGAVFFVLATAKDGGRAARPTSIEVPYTTSDISYTIPRVTYRTSPISLTEFEVSTRTFRTLIDVIPPLAPTGPTSAVR